MKKIFSAAFATFLIVGTANAMEAAQKILMGM